MAMTTTEDGEANVEADMRCSKGGSIMLENRMAELGVARMSPTTRSTQVRRSTFGGVSRVEVSKVMFTDFRAGVNLEKLRI